MRSTTNLSNFVAQMLFAPSIGSIEKQERLENLIAHVDEAVRARVADFTISVNHLIELSADLSPHVRIAVADNPATPISILELLSLDDHPDVRFAIAENANMPLEILHILSRDENPYVAWRAMATLERIEKAELESDGGLHRCA